ncbi:type II toxin-antitoxin system HicB family antitoxin [uncultured Thiodictyon sp.]|uniref:type II toxin-antitoxin system HicB family antitoxin n=1 Tax=uncultured Thiodictyon sp. TaxID=1846217 RepID=UPI0025EA7FC9|nr:type II toxin-antitoxin system HicB family antitoxin [uncultured Thiodictyon sp.]
MDSRYPATLTPEPDGGFVVQFIDFAEAFTEGDTLEEALFNAAEVLTLILEARMEEGHPIPAPSFAPDATLIAPSANIQAALLVRRARAECAFAEPTRTPDIAWPAAKHLENPHDYLTLKQLERVAAALGKRLVVAFE